MQLRVIIGADGRAVEITILSPLGYGLDEAAIKAIRQWVFEPAKQDGKPVSFEAKTEVTFRLEGVKYDRNTEQNRSRWNTLLPAIRDSDPQKQESTTKAVLELAEQKYPPAMHLAALWLREGVRVPKDPGER